MKQLTKTTHTLFLLVIAFIFTQQANAQKQQIFGFSHSANHEEKVMYVSDILKSPMNDNKIYSETHSNTVSKQWKQKLKTLVPGKEDTYDTFVIGFVNHYSSFEKIEKSRNEKIADYEKYDYTIHYVNLKDFNFTPSKL